MTTTATASAPRGRYVLRKLSELERTQRIDADFFDDQYVRLDEQLKSMELENLRAVANIKDGNHAAISHAFTDVGVPYYRGKDLSANFFIGHSAPLMITEEMFSSKPLQRSHLRLGDVLLSIVGTVGKVGLVTTDDNATCSCKLAILRPKSVSGGYLAGYLASRTGQALCKRWTRGAVQTGLLLEDMDQFVIPRLGSRLEDLVSSRVHDAELALNRSHDLILAAERDLIDLLPVLGQVSPERLTYESSMSAVTSARRLDAEYYQPSRLGGLANLRQVSAKRLIDFVASPKDMVSPGGPEMVRNFDLADALTAVLRDTVPPIAAVNLGSNKKALQSGDVVISRLRSYLRQIAIVDNRDDITPVGSSEFIVLRPRPGLGVGAPAIWAYLRSPAVQSILKWSRDGSQHPRFSEVDLLSLPVPDGLAAAAVKVAEDFELAERLRSESTHLLSEASLIVDMAIESGPAAAYEYGEQAVA